jgi:hypothetical protein
MSIPWNVALIPVEQEAFPSPGSNTAGNVVSQNVIVDHILCRLAAEKT